MSTRTRKLLKKLILVGDPGVGKTSFMNTYVNNKFSPNVKATIGADFLTKEILVDDVVVTLQIWDTAGRERWDPGFAFFRGADAAILFFDITEKRSFENAAKWKQMIEKNSLVVPAMILVGTKVDIASKRKVRMEVAEEVAEAWNIPFIEISSKENTSIQQAMKMLLDHIQIVEEEQYPTLTIFNDSGNDSGSWLGSMGSWLYSWLQPVSHNTDEKNHKSTSYANTKALSEI